MSINSQAVFTTRSILSQEETIDFVFHDQDGDWHFLPNREVSAEDVAIISLEQAFALDHTLQKLRELPKAHKAQRQAPCGWVSSSY